MPASGKFRRAVIASVVDVDMTGETDRRIKGGIRKRGNDLVRAGGQVDRPANELAAAHIQPRRHPRARPFWLFDRPGVNENIKDVMITNEHLARADALRIAAGERLDVIHVLLIAEPAERANRLGDILLDHARDRRTRGDCPSFDLCLAGEEDVAVTDARTGLLEVLCLKELPCRCIDAALALAFAILRQEPGEAIGAMLCLPVVEG